MVLGSSSGLLDVHSAVTMPVEAGPPPDSDSNVKRRKRKRAAGALLKKFNGKLFAAVLLVLFVLSQE